eukprot:11158476-Lingulodinium_polyedra.AAC.1
MVHAGLCHYERQPHGGRQPFPAGGHLGPPPAYPLLLARTPASADPSWSSAYWAPRNAKECWHSKSGYPD